MVDSHTAVVQSQLRNGSPQGNVVRLFQGVYPSKDLEGAKVNVVMEWNKHNS